MPVSTRQRWLRRLRSDGDMASRNIGRPRGAEAGVCVMFSSHVSSHISRRVIRVSHLWVRGCNEERIHAWITVDPCCTVASVRKRLQASGIGSARRRGCGKYLARHAFLADSVVVVPLCSIPRFKRSFLCGFLWFFAVSLAAFFLLSWLFGVVCHARFAPCSCCCSHVHVSSPIETTGGQADASCSRIAASRGSVGVRHISQLSGHMSFSPPLARA